MTTHPSTKVALAFFSSDLIAPKDKFGQHKMGYNPASLILTFFQKYLQKITLSFLPLCHFCKIGHRESSNNGLLHPKAETPIQKILMNYLTFKIIKLNSWCKTCLLLNVKKFTHCILHSHRLTWISMYLWCESVYST